MTDKLSVEILKYIRNNPRASPLLIARSLLRRPGLVRNHLVVLTELELIEAPVRGNYLITDLGLLLLNNLRDNINTWSFYGESNHSEIV